MRLPPYTIHDITPQAERPWNLDQVAAPSFWPQSKGGGAVVAVIDTGLDVNHPEFAGRVFKPYNLTTKDTGLVTDIVGHGTHVAGIIAGKTCGVAPEARIMPLKVFPDNPADKNIGLYINDAFLHLLDYNKTAPEADRVVAVNCSFGGGTYDPYMAYLIRRLTATGVTVVVSAGNSGDGNPETYEVWSYPAYIWECLTVGAMNQDGTGAVYSNSFDGIDLAAPGTLIHSAWPGGGYNVISGTSMAAPHVTGAMALIYDAWRKREGDWPTEEQAVIVLMKHIRKTILDYRLVGAGLLDLEWANTRWPLHRVQLGAFYNKANCDAKAAALKTMGIDTYKVKY
jgi:major intracellular serine protease